MTKSEDRDQLREYLDGRFDKLEQRIDRNKSRQTTVLVTAFLFIIGLFGGGFMFVNLRIDKNQARMENTQKDVQDVKTDLMSISGKMLEENPNSVVFKNMFDRYSILRGKQ